MRILITGAGGYIGRHLVPKLRDEGHQVVALHKRPLDGVDAHIDDKYGINWAHEHVVWVMKKNFLPTDTVIHLAGRVDINLRPNPNLEDGYPVPGPCDIGALYRDNVLATANVLDYCLKAGVKHLIFASTQAVYGPGNLRDEHGERKAAPLEYYAASKLAAEELLEIGARQGFMEKSLQVTILRIPGVYGGGRRSGLVYNLCKQAVSDGEMRLNLTMPVPLDVLHIDDVLGAFLAALHSEPQFDPMDITTGEPCSATLLLGDIAELTGSRVYYSGPAQRSVTMDPRPAAACLNWLAQPRKERLAQVLEEIRRGS